MGGCELRCEVKEWLWLTTNISVKNEPSVDYDPDELRQIFTDQGATKVQIS